MLDEYFLSLWAAEADKSIVRPNWKQKAALTTGRERTRQPLAAQSSDLCGLLPPDSLQVLPVSRFVQTRCNTSPKHDWMTSGDFCVLSPNSRGFLLSGVVYGLVLCMNWCVCGLVLCMDWCVYGLVCVWTGVVYGLVLCMDWCCE